MEGDYISREAAIRAADIYNWDEPCATTIKAISRIPAADVVEVQAVIERMNEERKRAKGNWHTDPYWLGWVDAMRRAERIVDGTIDDEPMYAPSTGEKKEDKQG
jgi:hypothetical protein